MRLAIGLGENNSELWSNLHRSLVRQWHTKWRASGDATAIRIRIGLAGRRRWSGFDWSRWADGGLKAGLLSWWRWTTKLEVAGVMGTLLVMEADGGAGFLWIWIVIRWDEKHGHKMIFFFFNTFLVRDCGDASNRSMFALIPNIDAGQLEQNWNNNKINWYDLGVST